MNDADLRRVALLISSLASFMTPFMVSSVNIALPIMGRELTMSAVGLGWVGSAYLLGAAVFLVPFGRLADLYGRKRIFVQGVAVYCLSSFALAAVPNAALLIALRVVQGISASMMFGTSVALLISIYPAKERGRALGIVTASVYLGLSVGPFAGGFITDYLGWRSLFIISALLGVVVFVITVLRLKGEWAAEERAPFDTGGAVLFVLMLTAILYGLSSLSQAWGWGLLAAGAMGAVWFFRRETVRPAPLVGASQFRGNTAFIYSNTAALINYAATFAVSFLLSLYLQYVKGLSPQQAGTVMVAQPIVMTIFSPAAGKLSDRIQPQFVASIGMGLAAAGLFGLAFLNFDTSLLFIVIWLGVLGFGFALFSSPNTNAVMSSVSKKHYGVASAVLGTMRLSGQMLSMAAATLILAWQVGKRPLSVELRPELMNGTRIAFAIFAVLCAIGVIFSFSRGKIPRGEMK